MNSIAKYTLYFSALLLILYPAWGILDPQSYLSELLETFPYAEAANQSQVKVSAGILWISNSLLAFSFVCLSRYIDNPKVQRNAKISSIALICYPVVLTLGDVWIGTVLSRQLEGGAVAVEFSGQKLFYIVFGLAIWGMVKSLEELNSGED